MITAFTVNELRNIAKKQKILLWSVLGGILSYFLIFSAQNQALATLILFGVGIFQIYALFSLASAIRSSALRIVLLIVGLFIPLVNLLMLLSINNEASKILKASGVKVGLMGANPDDIR